MSRHLASIARPLVSSARHSVAVAQRPSPLLALRRTFANVPPPQQTPPAPQVPVTDAAPQTNGGQKGSSGKKQGGAFRRLRTRFGRVVLFVVVASTGAFIYFTQKDLYPGTQLDQDPKKKTIVVLGNGWGATSFLKKLDNEEYNVVVISPRNYFLFTPLLPSVTVGTLDPRSILQPTRYITRLKKRKVAVYEAEATSVDPKKKTVTFSDITEVQEGSKDVTISYDYLVYAVGAESQTFGMEGVSKYACFLKELKDADKIRRRLLDCIETAAFAGQSEEEKQRLMHMVVVGGGATGIEYAGELHDFLIDDLKRWYPEIADKLKITLIEALPNVLPAFSKQLIQYTESTFKENKIDVLTRTMVKDVTEKSVKVQDANKEIREIPYGLLVWATGNTARGVTRKLMGDLSEHQKDRRGLSVDDHMRVLGAPEIFAIGDCTATSYAPTAQAASQQGTYLARTFAMLAQAETLRNELASIKQGEIQAEPAQVERKVKRLNKALQLPPFHYSHQGSLAYIGSEKAIADLPLFNGNFASGGVATYLFWQSAYVSTLYSARNRTLVILDWIKVKIFGRDVSRE